jgi:5-methylcytosine-specific restriction endonuclease McrA
MKAPRRKALFEAIFRRDGGRCAYCGVPVRRLRKGLSRAGDLATLDHVRPRSQGGRLEEGNLVLACRACNNARGTLDAEAFRAAVRGGPRAQETSGHVSTGAPAAALPGARAENCTRAGCHRRGDR